MPIAEDICMSILEEFLKAMRIAKKCREQLSCSTKASRNNHVIAENKQLGMK